MNNVLITGASGFLGKEIYNYLKSQHFNLISLGRSAESNIICDLSKEVPKLEKLKFDYVVHVAGLAHITPKSQQENEAFFKVNVEGTKKLLEALNENLPKTIIFISSVAVYGLDMGESIDENYPLNGATPYAKSKILVEKELLKFGIENGINIIILRPPLISGTNPSGNLGDLMRAIKKGFYFRIGKGDAKKSMVSSKDISKLIPKILDKNGTYNLTDNIHPTFKEIDSYIGNIYGKRIHIMPFWFIKIVSYIGDVIPLFPINSIKLNKMTKSLTFSNAKAVNELGWCSESALNELKE